MPKISIIVPVYNTEAYLPKCLDSIIAQSFTDFEAIFINDGSPDNSQAIIDRYVQMYPDKIISVQQKNAGQAAARNAGLRIARGEFIHFVDSDDYLHPDALQTAYTAACENGADVVCFHAYQVRDGEITSPVFKGFGCEDPIREFVLTSAVPWNKLIRRSILIDNDLFFSEGRIYEDFEFVPQLALHTKKFVFLEDRLYYYLIRSGSTMQQTRYNPKFNSIFPVMETMKERFAGSEYLQELECLFIVHMLHDSTLRFLPFPEGEESLRKISRVMKETFPRWYRNKYYRTMGIKYKIVCTLAYWGQIKLLRRLLKV